MSSIKVNGIELHFDDIQQVSRSAAPILLITGLGGVGAAWGPLIPEFTPERRVILPDHRGCGRSTHTTDGLTISQLANDMICPPYLGRELADAIPGATFTLLPDVGHYSHVENPQLVHGHIAKLLTLHDSLSR
jgi:pimeloyl-ACP methyl ester carboxylesterase